MASADYVIIGSGSAGSVLASRLSASNKHSVTVLEYGGTDSGALIQMPAALGYPMNMPLYDWGYKAKAEKNLNGRALVCPRGKVIGGSSSINGMIYVRGNALDYDYWQESGATGWGYQNVLPYLKRMETSHGGEAGFRGTNGDLQVTRGGRKNPLHHAFVEAAEQAGYCATSDYNGYRQEGFGAADMTVWRGSRMSAARAFLFPALKKHQKLQLIRRAFVTKINFDGKKAASVRYQKNNKTHTITANKEIILAAGAINSPKILQHSGIGNAKHLKQVGIDMVHELRGVGENLQDHLEVYFQLNCLQPITLYRYLNPLAKAMIGAQWLFFKSGIGASNQFETLGFIRSNAGVAYPDIQFHFLPVAISYDGKSAAKQHGFQLHVGPMRSKSRGHVRVTSNDERQAPEICFNYMSHADDWVEFRSALRLSREILAQQAMQPYKGSEIQPGDDVISDDGLDEFIRNHAESAYHPCGTAKMGSENDKMAVVDSECRVIGIQNLRVADSSIFPRITNGNLNAPSIMVGDKASDHILGNVPLPAENLAPFIHPNWQKSQR
ncbi:MAG: choline dehydrogenase [Alphaproteobacteria bacterium]|nr:choline dehydrogenase [Alphaproteobacteria bacterium]